MNKGLYNIFADKWYHGGAVWLYSDPHFGDETVHTLRRNDISDAEQIRRINAKVNRNDTIIFLGDIGNPKYISKIRGYKVLIAGNHDSGLTKLQEYFDEIYECELIVGPKLILSHEPINSPFKFNIHGHDHSGKYDAPNHLNVCAEFINYTPVNLKDVVHSGKLKNVENIHRATIDAATANKLSNIEKTSCINQ